MIVLSFYQINSQFPSRKMCDYTWGKKDILHVVAQVWLPGFRNVVSIGNLIPKSCPSCFSRVVNSPSRNILTFFSPMFPICEKHVVAGQLFEIKVDWHRSACLNSQMKVFFSASDWRSFEFELNFLISMFKGIGLSDFDFLDKYFSGPFLAVTFF